MILAGENRSTMGKTCPTATLSTTNLTWRHTGSTLGLRGGGRFATNRLRHRHGTKYSFNPRQFVALIIPSDIGGMLPLEGIMRLSRPK
jgi:hypothetical protein